MSSLLAHSPADIIRSMLVELGLDAGWLISDTSMPPTPDKAIVVTDTAPQMDAATMQGYQAEHYGLQLTVRAKTHGEGWVKANAVAAAMDVISRRAVHVEDSDYYVQAITRVSGPLMTGAEQGSQRRLFTINVLVSLYMVVLPASYHDFLRRLLGWQGALNG
jgi:hypothetical protein